MKIHVSKFGKKKVFLIKISGTIEERNSGHMLIRPEYQNKNNSVLQTAKTLKH